MMKEISRNRYLASVGFVKDPRTSHLFEELFFYENKARTVIGVVVKDRIDQNFSGLVLGRDANKKFSCVDTEIDFPDIDSAKNWVHEKSLEFEKSNASVITESSKGIDLFTPVVDESKFHPHFRYLTEMINYTPAKELLCEIAPHIADVDGNFVQQFQCDDFDARIWEIYLTCYFNEENLHIEKPAPAPDFLLTTATTAVAVEAVTISQKGSPLSVKDLSKIDSEYVTQKIKDEVPLYYSNSLNGKLNHTVKGKRYWELAVAAKKPLVFAVADFHQSFAMTWSSEALQNFLYGQKQVWHLDKDGKLIISAQRIDKHIKANGTEIPSGFFRQQDTENVSAVLHSTTGTLAKFNRMGKQCGFGNSKIIMMREVKHHDWTPDAVKPHTSIYEVSEKTNETWGEGVSVYHNPNAKYPLPFDFFGSAAQYFIKDDKLVAQLPPMHVYSNATETFIPVKGKPTTPLGL